MLYFKKVDIDNANRSLVETALRKVSLKRTMPLDFLFETTDIGTKKYFLGHEGNNMLTFTRIRTTFERFIPKLIVRFPLSGEESYYQLRLSLVSTVFFLMATFAWFALVVIALIANTEYNRPLVVTAVYLAYFSLILFESKIVKIRITKAIEAQKGFANL